MGHDWHFEIGATFFLSVECGIALSKIGDWKSLILLDTFTSTEQNALAQKQ